jgi:hypothetical protein
MVIAGLLLAACGGSDDTATSNDSAPSPAAATTSAVDAGGATPGASGNSATEESSVASDATTSPDGSIAGEDGSSDTGVYSGLQPGPNDAGSCHVDVTGAETASWDAGGGMSATLVEYWLSEDERATLGGTFGLIVNCAGDPGYVGLSATSAGSVETIPQAPGVYELLPGAAGLSAPILAGVDLTGSDATWGLDQPGTLDITAFDDEHIAGTFSFTATDLFGSVDGQIAVSGDFDFHNPNV